MQLRLLLLLIVVFGSSESSFVESRWANVFQSFFDPVIAPGNDSPFDDQYARLKRSVYASMGAQLDCEPGYTGQFCESPLCTNYHQPQHLDPLQFRTIDEFFLRQGCSGNATFPLDSESLHVRIQISNDVGTITATLIDDQGNVLPPTAYFGGVFIWQDARPGQYELKVTSDSQATMFCDVLVETETKLTADVGFVFRPQDDTFEAQIAYNAPQYIVVHPYFLIEPATINTVYIYENNRDHTRYVSQLQPRYGCGYEYYAGEYTCQMDMTGYRWVVEGIDNKGYVWRRSGQFTCINRATQTPPSTPTQPPPKYCKNGGMLLYPKNGGEPFCYCREFFTGDMCEFALCMNGGTPGDDDTVCRCPPGYSGNYCEHVICIEPIDQDYFTDIKSLVLVVRQSPNIVSLIPDLVKSINLTVNGYWKPYRVYSNYLLTIFGSNGAVRHEYTDFVEFLNKLIEIGNTPATATSCSDDVIAGITEALGALVIYHKSPVFVLTDVAPNDTANWMDVYGQNSFRKLPIYTLFLTDNSASCKTETLSSGYRTLQDISLTSGGLILTPNNGSYVQTFTQTIRRVTYLANYVTINEFSKCMFQNHMSFIVERGAVTVTILATGTNLSLTVTNPKWDVLNSSSLQPVIFDGSNYIWDLVQNYPGEYLYYLNATDGGNSAPCSIRIITESKYDMWIGASGGLMEDMGLPDPLYQYGSNMVVHINGFRGMAIDPFRLFAEMQIDSWSWDKMSNVPVYYSSGIYRDGCTFHLYFGSFTCKDPEQRYIITVFADDEVGMPIQRSAPSFCVPFQYTTVPPNGQCYNGGAPNPTNTSQCICPPNWSSTNCTMIVCANNGTSMGSYCNCPAQTTGQFCESLMCYTMNTNVNFNSGGRGLGFVLNVRNTMTATLQDIANQASAMVRDLINADGFEFISYFSVAWFNQEQGQLIKSVSADHVGSFIMTLFDVVNLTLTQPITDPNNCQVKISDGLYYLLEDFENNNIKNSYVFVFTDSDFDNNSIATYYGSLIKAQDLQTSVNFVVTNYNLCGSPHPNQGPSEIMIQMARDTSGFIYYTQHAGNLLQVIPTFHKSSLVYGYEGDCSTGVNAYIPIDGWSQSFVVTAQGENIQVDVNAPVGVLFPNNYKNEIDKDTYLHVIQYLIPCEGDNWNTHGQFCYIFPNPTTPENW